MLQEISFNMVLGVVAGLTATGLTIFFKSIWDRIIIPWYEERIYKDVKIEGRWCGEINYKDGDKESFIFEIRRKSHSIEGEMISKDDGKIYDFQGGFHNTILTITYTSRNVQEVDRGCFTFLLTKNGRELNGNASYYYNPDHKVETAPIILVRENI